MRLPALMLAAALLAFPLIARADPFVNGSTVIGSTAQDVFGTAPGLRARIVAIDEAVALDTTGTVAVTTWCAWGTKTANPAVIGSNGFPLGPGIDDGPSATGAGVNQGPMNCIQASGSTHYIRLETY